MTYSEASLEMINCLRYRRLNYYNPLAVRLVIREE